MEDKMNVQKIKYESHALDKLKKLGAITKAKANLLFPNAIQINDKNVMLLQKTYNKLDNSVFKLTKDRLSKKNKSKSLSKVNFTNEILSK